MPKKVLVADDDESMVKLISATLGYNERYQLAVAHDGREALDVAFRENPDLVILDIVMPKLDGSVVCRALKSSSTTAHAKVIMLTALTLPSDRQRAILVSNAVNQRNYV